MARYRLRRGGGPARSPVLVARAVTDHADTIRRHIYGQPISDERALACLAALLAERQQAIDALRETTEALNEACDWLDADLAYDPDTTTAMADRELVASWRSTLARAALVKLGEQNAG